MKLFLDFFSFQDPNVRYVVLGTMLITGCSAIVGCFNFLKKKSLVGDAVAHAVLPGIALSFILYGEKNPLILIIGAFITGWLSLISINYIDTHSKIKQDTAIGLVLSVFFGIGILFLTIIQNSGNGSQSGLNHFLFGKAASIVPSDLMVFGIVSVFILLIVFALFKEFILISFDIDFAKSIGLPVYYLELLLTSLTVLAVVIGIQVVGVVLMAAMLITPPSAARFWTDNSYKMIWLAAIFASLSGLAGTYISFTSAAMPTGPWIVIIVSFFAIFSFFFAPQKGILSKIISRYKIRNKIADENVLKALYHLGEKNQHFYEPRTVDEIISKRYHKREHLIKILSKLRKQGYVEHKDNKWRMTNSGKNKGQRTVKLHRLWEVYLIKYLKLAPDHVHEDAETIEHVLTPDLEKQLEKLLGYPTIDPHQSQIPYRK